MNLTETISQNLIDLRFKTHISALRVHMTTSPNTLQTFQTVESVICEIVNNLSRMDFKDVHLNERYLHHLFSEKIQAMGYPIVLNGGVGLHPEWATYIRDVRCEKACRYHYAKSGNESEAGYQIVETMKDKGSSGFIDFAVGDYNKPDCAIEFKMAQSIVSKGIIFDYMKLLDSRSIFKTAVSLCVFYNLSNRNDSLHGLLSDCLEKAKERLKGHVELYRPFRFHTICIYKDGSVQKVCLNQ